LVLLQPIKEQFMKRSYLIGLIALAVGAAVVPALAELVLPSTIRDLHKLGLSATGNNGDIYGSNLKEADKAAAPLLIPDCPSTDSTPFLWLRNTIPGTQVTSVVVAPITEDGDHVATASKLLFTKNIIGDDPVSGVPLNKILNATNQLTIRCGVPLDFTQIAQPSVWGVFGYQKSRSIGCDPTDKLKNIYKIGITMSVVATGDEYKLLTWHNVCDESMLEIVPGDVPSKDRRPFQHLI
jgi:hypothetical protein